VFFADALAKGRFWKSKYIALWIMRDFEVYETAEPKNPTPADVIRKSSHSLVLTQVENWLKPILKKELHSQSVEMLDTAVAHLLSGVVRQHAIDPEIFVGRLTDCWPGRLVTHPSCYMVVDG
jgi:hypothetical protein